MTKYLNYLISLSEKENHQGKEFAKKDYNEIRVR
jgi:hypothetical protein